MSIRMKKSALAVAAMAVMATGLTTGQATAETTDKGAAKATAKPGDTVIPKGYAFADGRGAGNYDRMVFPPGAMTAATVIMPEEQYNSGAFPGYDFSPDTSKLYGVADDGYTRALGLFDQVHNGRIESVVGPMALRSGHSWMDLTIDPVSGAAYAASVTTAAASRPSAPLATAAATAACSAVSFNDGSATVQAE